MSEASYGCIMISRLGMYVHICTTGNQLKDVHSICIYPLLLVHYLR